MKDYKKLRDAFTYAVGHYDGEVRKGSNIPYIIHPLHILTILRSTGFSDFKDEDLMISALFHDLIEDTEVCEEDIADKFGKKIASIVKELSNPENCDKEDHFRKLSDASYEAKVIKLADRIDNLSDIHSLNWTTEKKRSYLEQGKIILESCGDVQPELAEKLKEIIQKSLKKLKNK
jgi:(p)ppGpp synthase/HD superfamily hydrolase